MNKEELVVDLIKYFISENDRYSKIVIPIDYKDRRLLLRGLINMRKPLDISNDILDKEDKLLQLELKDRNIVNVLDIDSIDNKISVWQGDITCIRCDAIVNAGNEDVLGCFIPNHNCIDSQIHSMSGIRMRLECNNIMNGGKLDTSKVIVTGGYNLPCTYVIHTVGPMVYGRLTDKEIKELEDTYRNCLDKARELGIRSIVFPCISTGVFKFPKDRACEIAVGTVRNYLNKYGEYFDRIVFNVFKDEDLRLYINKLGSDE